MEDTLMTYEMMKGDRRQGRVIAWVIGLGFALVVIAFFWNTSKKETARANERATDYAFNLNSRLSSLEGNEKVVDAIVTAHSASINSLDKQATANKVEVDAIGRTVDQVTIVGAKPFDGYGRGRGGVAPAPFGQQNPNTLFNERNVYQKCDSQLIQNTIYDA